MKEWRWSLTETSVMAQHTGGQEELRDAMNDVANTVEYILCLLYTSPSPRDS